MVGQMVQIEIGRVVKETPKAVQVEIEVARRDGGPRTWSLWLPKSQVSIVDSTVTLPEWLGAEKMTEVFEKTNSLIVVRYSNGDVMM
jgi:hypothetical protein